MAGGSSTIGGAAAIKETGSLLPGAVLAKTPGGVKMADILRVLMATSAGALCGLHVGFGKSAGGVYVYHTRFSHTGSLSSRALDSDT